uniref:Uncharacterized protein n=1 Tax=Rhizophora mucronata TaxID=61149 RepID=A0A2P2NPU1_RHIMU
MANSFSIFNRSTTMIWECQVENQRLNLKRKAKRQ